MKRQRRHHASGGGGGGGGGGVVENNNDDDDDDDEDDAFSALSRSSKKKRGKEKKSSKAVEETKTTSTTTAKTAFSEDGSQKTPSPSSTSSSTNTGKRHHFVTSERQAKMNALLEELASTSTSTSTGGSYHDNRPPPEKRGSFVEAGEEWSTTNIFVGNLAPSITEEELTETFRQFGDLYSVKIMWPRTDEERARNRNTGFVCFMNRPDAQEAMDALQDSDALRVGRRLMLRWGKNVKKTVKRGTGGVAVFARKKAKTSDGLGADNDDDEDEDDYEKPKTIETKRDASRAAAAAASTAASCSASNQIRKREEQVKALDEFSSSSKRRKTERGAEEDDNEDDNDAPAALLRGHPAAPPAPVYDPTQHAASAIRVVAPADLFRRKFITTVAFFVAKDGSILERRLLEKEGQNPQFSFLSSSNSADAQNNAQERIFYRWRVYAFCQGDGFDSWRTEPFVMLQPPHGRFWIPPPILNTHAARQEEEAAQRKEVEIRTKQEERRKLSQRKKEYMTGRQLERAKQEGVHEAASTAAAKEGAALLTPNQVKRLDDLIYHKLCASRHAIEAAMAFCLENAGAAQQVSEKLRQALLETKAKRGGGGGGGGISVETRIARLYLLSDVLFNSQQPGVRNAFCYRNALEELAPDMFTQLGKIPLGRWTKGKLRRAVESVLSAWTQWSVYSTTFLEELQARFDGKEWKGPLQEEEEEEEEDEEEANEKEKGEQQQRQQDKDDIEIPIKQEGNLDANVNVVEPTGGQHSTEATSETHEVKKEMVEPKQEWTDVTEQQDHFVDDGDDGNYDGEPLEEDDYPLILVATE